MNRRKVVLIVLFIVLAIVAGYMVIYKRGSRLISPVIKQDTNRQPLAAPVSAPPAPVYNPPKEINYDASTDLKKELESINPQVLDSDFE